MIVDVAGDDVDDDDDDDSNTVSMCRSRASDRISTRPF